MLASRNTYTWIQKYIFPGGLIPSVEAVVGITERETRLRTVGMLSLRPHYAETLRLWRERFIDHREAVSALGFDETFHRMWELYLAYSEAGFRSGYLDVYQWTFAPTGAGSMNFVVVSVAALAILVLTYGITLRRRPPDRTLQRRRRHLGSELRRGGGRRRRHSVPVTCSAASCCSAWSRCGACGWPGTW